MAKKFISLGLTAEIVSMVDWLHIQLSCSRQEVIRRCIIYCTTCPKQVNDYLFSRALLTPKEVKNEEI